MRFLNSIIFNESTFHIKEKVNTHICRIWRGDLREIIENIRDSQNVNLFYAICKFKVYEPYFFLEKKDISPDRLHITHLDMFENFLISQIDDDNEQEDVVPFKYPPRWGTTTFPPKS